MRAEQFCEAAGFACGDKKESYANIEHAARDAWKRESSPGERWCSWTSDVTNQDSNTLDVGNVWKETGNASGDAWRRLCDLELRAKEDELLAARTALSEGDVVAAARGMRNADYWMSQAERDLVAQSVGAGEGAGGGGSCGDGAGRCGGADGTGEGGFGGSGGEGGSGGFVESPNSGDSGLHGSGSDDPDSSEGSFDEPVSDSSVGTSIGRTGEFTVENGHIYDPSGKEFQPRGMCVDDPDILLQDVDEIVNKWRPNIVRVNAWDWSKNAPYQDLTKLDKVVDEYTKRGVVVEIADGTPIGGMLTGGALAVNADFYQRAAERYKNNPYVWLATPNESGAPGNTPANNDQVWMNEALSVDRAIRSTGARNIIVQGDANWGQGQLSGTGVSELVKHAHEFQSFGNVVAGEHVYNNNSDVYEKLTKEISELKAAGFPVFFDEFGAGAWVNGRTEDVRAGADAVFRAVEEQHVGAQAFEWKQKGGPLSFTTEGRGDGQVTAYGNNALRMMRADA